MTLYELIIIIIFYYIIMAVGYRYMSWTTIIYRRIHVAIALCAIKFNVSHISIHISLYITHTQPIYYTLFYRRVNKIENYKN